MLDMMFEISNNRCE